jgi:acetyl-CoA carboxylase biotin carboxyl carrier protein
MAKKKKKAVTKTTSNGATGPLKEIKELYGFMQDNNLQTVELDRKDFHVKLVRRGAGTVPVPVPVAVGGAPVAAAAPAAAPTSAAPVAEALPSNAYVVKSPMMGIFYRSASPSSPPFVKEGQVIKKGEVVCLIEAMKVFNDIKSEAAGKIVKVCLENGKSVKVGQDLYILERA